jgi:cytoskeletal protein CcmA (bactofilin family)
MTMPKRGVTDSDSGPVTYITAGTSIVGNLSGDGTYIFCGRIEGDCDINGSLTIAESCHWKGKIRATDIILAGSVEGDVTATRRVDIADTARISGRLRARSIAVAEGAVIEGDIGVNQTKKSQKPKPDARLYPSRAVS